jgi:GTPase
VNIIKKEIYDIDVNGLNGDIASAVKERAVLVGVETSTGMVSHGKTEVERSLDELEELASTAGAVTLQKLYQKRSGHDAAYYAGKGFIEKLNVICGEIDANLIIFDDELSATQLRNIEKLAGIRVIDRTTLILDIFAGRAK